MNQCKFKLNICKNVKVVLSNALLALDYAILSMISILV